jgi:hypothetical protein
MNTAEIIRDQIKTLDPYALAAWGVKDQLALEDGYQFKTSGLTPWKGIVQIKYNRGSDLYNVVFGKIRKGEWKVQETIEDVYAFDLVQIIDRKVG